MPITSQRSGLGYFIEGIKLAFSPGIRRFVLFPLLANLLLVGGAMYYLFTHLDRWINQWIEVLPDFLSWLSYLLWPLLTLTILGTFSYFFSTLANFIAAPLNGLLAEKVEQKITGQAVTEQGIVDLIKDTPRILLRECRKMAYMIPKAIGLFLLLLIPALGQTVGPVLWFIFTAWMLSIQYCDYPFDNHKVDFNTMRNSLKQKQSQAYGFGIVVSMITAIPVLNLFIMPVAVCGATAMWVGEFKNQYRA
ncbi:sulfate transporter CysZ [Vibrio cincinnatiensis]|uniref:sulfate transporter CysZ n=1 Tax=Vibrio cincinnatiensis TaxID=675 RepID=UPI0012ACB712|nr:sulfate transporter CysZ [Vibrio cincinnatiensis]MCG3726452.1 sulfate transporter CysZ [Vibrio cincinnatiensis]MCG3731839.1 sulfate transporter CysZ [Vibrio cincinnatiensis]MCG3736978.1 sulfate transporter CysZ [Vibrio cincinnatiensis]MCG3739535.1 sulfate transporter CysZ [Vibrio cincinnatiensis]MCG3742092.1 sulfate transporter CysZ [Vibrio cincinnatiensis]